MPVCRIFTIKTGFFFTLPKEKDARDAIRTHEPLQERILSPSELAGLSYPRALNYYLYKPKKESVECYTSVQKVNGSFSGCKRKKQDSFGPEFPTKDLPDCGYA
jgi:hypothetical protein